MKISAIEPIILESPYENRAPEGSEEAAGVKHLLLLKVSTDEGIVGWADVETAPHIGKAVLDAPLSGSGMIDGLTQVYLNRDPFHVEQLWDDAYRASAYYGRRGVAIQIMSGMDIACHDIIGKAIGAPVSSVLGARRRDRVRAYASTLFRSTPDAMAEACRRYVAEGFTAVKFGWGCFGDDPRRDIALVQAAREAAGDGVDILVDAGWRIHRTAFDAVALIRELENLNVFWLEDFLHPEDYEGYRAVASRPHSVRIAAGEQEATAWGFEQLISRGRVDVIQPDLSRCGGFSQFRKIAWEAEKASVSVCPHAWMTDIITAASLHANAYLPQSLFLEYNTAMSPMLKDVTGGAFRLDGDGCLGVPMGPGLGIEIDEAAISHYRVV